MIFEGELQPHFASGRIVGSTPAFAIYYDDEVAAATDESTRDAVIRERFGESVFEALQGKSAGEKIYEEPIEWDDTEEPHVVSAGFFVYATEIDWEAGTLSAEIFDGRASRDDHLFWDAEEHLGSAFKDPTFDADLEGLSFSADAIEMMLPGAEVVGGTAVRSVARNSAVGRPRKWDWEGAMAHIAGVAQHPDGLPTGAGAQAAIEKIIAEWFVTNTDESPAVSQIRQRAQTIIRSISKGQ